jgi:hypothetical protein
MNEVQYEAMQEDAAIGQAMAEALQYVIDHYGVETVERLGRSIYKYTDCGAWLSVKLHDGTWKHTGNLTDVSIGNVRALMVGSIVEGSDAEVKATPLDLMDYLEEGGEKRLLDDLEETIEWVDGEAGALWDEANGSDDEE